MSLPGPLAYWPLDDGIGSTIAADAVGSNDGTLTNMDPGSDWVAGSPNITFPNPGALDFDGSNDYITAGNVLNAGTSDWSVSLWYKADVTGSTQVLLVKGLTGGNHGYEILLHLGQIRWDLQGTGGAFFGTTATEPTGGVWHHVAGILDRATNTATLYVDGVAVASSSVAGIGNLDNPVHLGLGALNRTGASGSTVQFFNGQMDDVRIYDAALSPAQVAALAAGGAGGGSFTDPGADTWTGTVNYGDSTGDQSLALNTDKTFDLSHTYGHAGDYTVTVEVDDNDGGVGQDTVAVHVDNVAPTISPVTASDTTIDENNSIDVSATFSDPSWLDTITGTIDCGTGGVLTAGPTITQEQVEPDNTGTITGTCSYPDDDPTDTLSDIATITVTVEDDFNEGDNASADVTINNVDPVVSVTGDTISEDGTATILVTLSDVGTLDTHTIDIDWGTGETADLGVAISVGVTSFTHQYLDDNPTSTASDLYTVGVAVTDDDSGTDSDSTTVTVNNVDPVVSVTGETISEDGTATIQVTLSDTGTLDTHTIDIDWGTGETADLGVAISVGVTSFTHQYLDDNPTSTASDVYTVDVTVTDDDSGTDSDSTTVTVDNVDPVITSATGDSIDEFETASVSATYTDVGTQDTHTATVDWGEGTVDGPFVVTGGIVNASHQYGDDGSFTVTITVTDDDGGEAETTVTVDVANVDPELTLDHAGSIMFLGGEAFIGRVGIEQSHSADGSDIGSDDLTFDWTFAPDATTANNAYFNDEVGVDPDPSPDVNSISQTDSASVTFATAGVYTVAVTLTDDDGGSDDDSLTKLVQDVRECTRSQGFWGQQFREKGNKHVDATTLALYLDMIQFASGVYSEVEDISTLELAAAIMTYGGPDKRIKAHKQLLAAWLNFASGAIGWTELVDTDGDSAPDTALGDILAQVEAILSDLGASNADLVIATSLAESVNLHDASSTDCGDEDAGNTSSAESGDESSSVSPDDDDDDGDDDGNNGGGKKNGKNK